MAPELEDPLKLLSAAFDPDKRHAAGMPLATAHATLSAIVLHDGVPQNIRQAFETAKNVSLYSWFVFRFHQVAELMAFVATEFALRERAYQEGVKPRRKHFTLSELLDTARRREWISNDGFSAARRLAFARARHRKMLEIVRADVPDGGVEIPEPSEAEVKRALDELPLVDRLVEGMPLRRNWLAHGSPELHPSSRGTLATAADLINQLFPNPKDTC